MYEVSHIGMVVKDIERSAEFYRRVLGCEHEGYIADAQLKILMLKAGNQVIELLQFLQHEYSDRQAGVVDHICFKVKNMDEAVNKLRADGVTLLFDAPKEMSDGRKIIFFAGPDGERLEFLQEVQK
jgi:lactoylglutathione lyase